MKLSSRGRYGLKAMVDLAIAYGTGPVSVAALSKAQGTSIAYLEQLIASLRKAALVRSIRGAQGGYELAREPKSISVGEVLLVLEGSLSLVDCVEASDSAYCEKACLCSARPLFLKLQNKIDGVLYETTLLDLAQDNLEQKRRIET
ncbi:Rrf2 family transcriptional regulator [Christensenellaceae bacterium OttesenSCG-928-M15]|nr:Rrf2 family transcriptional regulator [Christensenellaceae bacterium OttesenSCG-928-M15]